MTIFSRTWNGAYETNPADVDDANVGAQRIRELKLDIRERLEVDHIYGNGSTEEGYHTTVHLKEQASDPALLADFGTFYTKDENGITQPYYIDSGGIIIPVNTVPIRRGTYLCPSRNLTGVWVSNTTATFTADSLLLETSGGFQRQFTSFNKTVNITTSGAGGLDTGSEAASTWYHIWAIAKADGTQSIICSTSNSSPTLPTGYIFKGYVGAIFNDGSSNFQDLQQIEDEVTFTALTCLNAGTSTSDSSLNGASGVIVNKFNALIPNTARRSFGYAGVRDTGAGTGNLTIRPILSSSRGQIVITNPGGTASLIRMPFSIPTFTNFGGAHNMYYNIGDATEEGSIVFSGWKF